MYEYMENKLSPYLCEFPKGYSTQYCLMVMLERFRNALDKKKNLEPYLLTYQKLLIVSIMNFLLPNWQHMDLPTTL